MAICSACFHVCQTYFLGIGNIFTYQIMMIVRVTKSGDKSSGIIS